MIDITKPEQYMTRRGDEIVQLFHFPGNIDYNKIICFYKENDGEVYTISLSENGEFCSDGDSGYDLIKKLVVLICTYPNDCVIHGIYEEGEGLD